MQPNRTENTARVLQEKYARRNMKTHNPNTSHTHNRNRIQNKLNAYRIFINMYTVQTVYVCEAINQKLTVNCSDLFGTKIVGSTGY